MKKYFFALLVMPLLAVTACNKGGDATNPSASNFDRKTMLVHYADDFIKPAFTGLQQDLALLQAATNAFADTPGAATLSVAKVAWTTGL